MDEIIYKKVDSLLFGFMSPKEIKKLASVKIVTPELYDKEGFPVDGGLMDRRLGIIDPSLRCKTCGGNIKECLGHFGYIELARPVIHILLVPLIYDILNSTCRECGRVLIPDEKIKTYKRLLAKIEEEEGVEARRNYIKKIIKELKTEKKCPHCGAKQERVNLHKPYTFMLGERRLNPIEIRAWLEKIKDEDCQLFDINPKQFRPEWAILTLLPVPPVAIRPSITLETGERSEDDLTHKLGDIVRINQRLFENINAGAPEVIIEDLWDLLQYHVTTYFNNEVVNIPPARHRSGQPLKTITQRIKSKEGRIRHNLAGKRTNFSARSVISPDPMLDLNEVGVPEEIATNLTVPEKVTEWNIEYLKQFIRNGPDKYPGANYVIKPDGKRRKINDETKEQILEELQPGYVVERHLLDGDIALFNRQPSLHRMSMMCHKVRVLPGKTLRLNPAVCAPYNADFDGDEMNLHIPQTEEARAEAESLMLVQNHIISPRYGLSIIGCIQDGITGNYLLTTGLKLDRKDAIDLLYRVGIKDFKRLGRAEKVDGKDVFSCLLPEDFNFIGHTKSGEEIIIKDGRIISGFVDSAVIGGEGAGLMLKDLYKNYGSSYTVNVISKMFRLGIYVLEYLGFTTSISDTDLPENIKEQIAKIIEDAEHEVNELIDKYHKGELEPLPGRTLKDSLEQYILKVLNLARNKIGEIVAKYAHESGTTIMAKSGARGKALNLAQMAGCVGQQALRGDRINIGFSKRTLPHFPKSDLGADAHGFIRKGFKDGLNPAEFFFMAITGRDSLMDTALRTPKSGYLYRRLANALQDLHVDYDLTVRDADDNIIQFVYGEDGIDVSKSEGGKINVSRIIDKIEKVGK